MRPPFREAAAMLGAAGHAAPVNLYAPVMPKAADVRYALLDNPRRGDLKPRVYERLGDLVAAIERRRKGAALQLVDAAVRLCGEERPRQGVSVWACGLDGDADRYLGWAYLGGAGWQSLKAALPAELATVRAAA